MKVLTYFILSALLITASCAGTNKRLRSGSDPEASKKTILMPSTPIREVEEKLVSNDEKAPDPHKYFVIIGSFRDPVNAKEHQAIVIKDGFKSIVLKNDAGLYRVSVMATEDITAARAEVRKIWARFPAYSDTWMLISK
ncbi:MAG: SPOR domain-containing protein [Bacteroidales bacterium]